MGPSEGGFFDSFSARLWSLVSLLHHAFLWQNSADWQGMNDARCFGTDPSLPPFFFPGGGGAAISMMRRHKMGTASAARAQHKQRRGIDGLETKKQARKGTCFKGRVSVRDPTFGGAQRSNGSHASQAEKRGRKCSPALVLHCQMGGELLVLHICCFECPSRSTRSAKRSRSILKEEPLIPK